MIVCCAAVYIMNFIKLRGMHTLAIIQKTISSRYTGTAVCVT
jgi:hypothetical protein